MGKILLLITILSLQLSGVNAQSYEELKKVLPDTIYSSWNSHLGYSTDIDGSYSVAGSIKDAKAYVFHFYGT